MFPRALEAQINNGQKVLNIWGTERNKLEKIRVRSNTAGGVLHRTRGKRARPWSKGKNRPGFFERIFLYLERERERRFDCSYHQHQLELEPNQHPAQSVLGGVLTNATISLAHPATRSDGTFFARQPTGGEKGAPFKDDSPLDTGSGPSAPV